MGWAQMFQPDDGTKLAELADWLDRFDDLASTPVELREMQVDLRRIAASLNRIGE